MPGRWDSRDKAKKQETEVTSVARGRQVRGLEIKLEMTVEEAGRGGSLQPSPGLRLVSEGDEAISGQEK